MKIYVEDTVIYRIGQNAKENTQLIKAKPPVTQGV
jgi:hypothetical protein